MRSARSAPKRAASSSRPRFRPGMTCPPLRPEAPPDLARLDQGDADAALGKVEGGGKAREAAADDADLDPDLLFQRRAFRAGSRGRRPERALGQQLGAIHRGYSAASGRR